MSPEAADQITSQEYQERYDNMLSFFVGTDVVHLQNESETLDMQLNPPGVRQLLEIQEGQDFIYVSHCVDQPLARYNTELSVGIAFLSNGWMICESTAKSAFFPHYPTERIAFRIGFQESDPAMEELKRFYLKRAFAIDNTLTLGKPTTI
jgi:phage pi2 protein 07